MNVRTIKKHPRVRFVVNRLADEQKMIAMTTRKRQWFIENGYRFLLPDDHVVSEYNEKYYFGKLKKIEKRWRKNERKFFLPLHEFFSVRSNKKFIVHLSRYGVGGGYTLPNHIFLNIDLPFDPVNIIRHEVLHILVEPIVKKYKIDHAKKERIVDCLMGLFRDT